MVKIRLTRIGRTHAPQYRIVAVPARSKRDGATLEILGFYDPTTKPSTLTIKKERVEYWLGNGAQPTETVARMLIKQGILKEPKQKKTYNKQPGRKSQERNKVEQPKAEKAPEPVKEETVVEAVEAPVEAEKSE